MPEDLAGILHLSAERRWLGPAGAIVLALLCAFGNHVWFFALELKQYSADTFGGLALPSLAVGYRVQSIALTTEANYSNLCSTSAPHQGGGRLKIA